MQPNQRTCEASHQRFAQYKKYDSHLPLSSTQSYCHTSNPLLKQDTTNRNAILRSFDHQQLEEYVVGAVKKRVRELPQRALPANNRNATCSLNDPNCCLYRATLVNCSPADHREQTAVHGCGASRSRERRGCRATWRCE